MFYDRFIELCNLKKVSRTKACMDCGISRTAWHKWESGATPNGATINKFATYFGVTVGYLMGEKTKKEPVLTAKDERDIARNLEMIMADLENSGDLMFDGDPMSDEARASMRSAIELGLRAVKQLNKETYTPKKYRKG